MSPLAIVYVVINIVFGLVFLIDCIRFRHQVNRYAGYGVLLGVVLIGIDMGVLASAPSLFKEADIGLLVVISVIAFIKIVLAASMGMFSSVQLGIQPVPWLRKAFAREALPPRVRSAGYLVALLVVVGLGVAYSFVLFSLTSPSLSAALKELTSQQASTLGAAEQPSLLLVLAVVEFAFAEEVIFRLGVQNYLARQFKLSGRRYWVAVVLASAFWSLAHANTLDPEWVKLAQVFPVGLALGFLYRRYGTEFCILCHAGFNVVMVWLGPSLIQG
jgi:hypothetical protein